MSGESVFRLTVQNSDIWYLSWTLDAYEGIGILSTDDAKNGHVSILCPQTMEGSVEKLLSALQDEGIGIELRGRT